MKRGTKPSYGSALGIAGDLGLHVAILSPHLDDAVLSLGATIERASRLGTRVDVVTVFGNDPDSAAPSGAWDAVCGFRTEGEAGTLRREEDRHACALVGAHPVWLPFRDVEYERDLDEPRLWQAIADAVRGAETVLIPGFPLAAPDHLLTTRMLLSRPLPDARVGLYVEQPYATWRMIGRGGRTGAANLTFRGGIQNLVLIGTRSSAGRERQMPALDHELLDAPPGVEWLSLGWRWRDWRAKSAAIRAYRSQVENFGPLVVPRIALYEFGWGGEALAWLPSS
jgi:hypothetical protein